MKIHFKEGQPALDVDRAIMEAGIPTEYEGFVRNIMNLPPDEREAQIAQMSDDADFKKSADQVRSFFRTYDSVFPRSAAAPEKPAEEPVAVPDAGAEGTPAEEQGPEDPRSYFRSEFEKLKPVFRNVVIPASLEKIILIEEKEGVRKFFDHLEGVLDSLSSSSSAEGLKEYELKISLYKGVEVRTGDKVVQISLADLMGDVDRVEQIVGSVTERFHEAPTAEVKKVSEGLEVPSEKAVEKPGKLEKWEEDLAIEILASLGIESVDEQEMRDVVDKFREEYKNSGRSAESLIRGRLSDPDMIRNFAKKWEEKYDPERVWKKRTGAFNEGKMGDEEFVRDLPRTKEGMPRNEAPEAAAPAARVERAPIMEKRSEAQEDLEKWEADLATAVLRYNGIEAPDEDEVRSQAAEIRAEAVRRPIREVISGMMDIASTSEVERLLEHWEDEQPLGAWENEGGSTSAEETRHARLPEESPRLRNAGYIAHSEQFIQEFMKHWEGEVSPARNRAMESRAEFWEAKNENWQTIFRKADISNGAWAVCEGGPATEQFMQNLDDLIGSLSRDENVRPLLKKYRLYVHEGSDDAVTEGGNIRVSASSLMKNGPAALEELLIGAIRKQEGLTSKAETPVRTTVSEREWRKRTGAFNEGKMGDEEFVRDLPRTKEGMPHNEIPAEPRENRMEFWNARSEYWNSIFERVDITEQSQEWAVAEGGPGAEQFLKNIDEFVNIIAADPEILPLLKGYRLYIHGHDVDLVSMGAASDKENIRVSASGLIKHGPRATAEFFIAKIRGEKKSSPEAKRPAPRAERFVGPEPEPESESEAETAARVAQERERDRIAGEFNEGVANHERPGTRSPDAGTRDVSPAGRGLGERRRVERSPEADEDRENPSERPSRYIPPEERPGWRDKVKGTASRVAERFGAKNLVDWTRIAYSKPFIDWNTSRAVRLKARLDDRRHAIDTLENNQQYLENEFRKVNGGELIGMEKDRARIEKDIEKNKNAANRLQSKLEYRNNQRSRFENRRNEICRGFMDRIEDRLNPFEEKLSDLKMTKGQLVQEIDTYRESLTVQQAKIAELKKHVEAEQFPSVRKAHRTIIKQIERKTKDIKSEIAAREKDRGRIDKKITKQDKKANPLRDKRDKLAMITRRQGPDTSVAQRERERASFETREVGGHSRVEGEEDEDESDGSSLEGEARPRRPESEKIYSGEDLVAAWNDTYGSRMKVNPETAKKSFPSLFTAPHSVAEFEDFLGFYGERHGDDERFAEMPSMQKAARKKRGFWKKIFGGKNKTKTRSRILEALNPGR